VARTRPAEFAVPLLLLAMGVLLIWLAVPRTIAAFAALPGNPVAEALQYGQAAPADELDTLRSGRRLARQFARDGRLDTDIALADLALLELDPAGATAAPLLAESIVLLRRGLSLAPANGYAWARLAYALRLGGRPSPAAAAAWRMSILTVPVDGRLAVWRVALGLDLLPALTAEDRQLLAQQIGWAWRFSRSQLVKLAHEPIAAATIRSALATQPDQLSQFDALLAH
jgi:hypothetical protein